MTLHPDAYDRYMVIAVQALAPATRLPAGYVLRLEPPE